MKTSMLVLQSESLGVKEEWQARACPNTAPHGHSGVHRLVLRPTVRNKTAFLQGHRPPLKQVLWNEHVPEIHWYKNAPETIISNLHLYVCICVWTRGPRCMYRGQGTTCGELALCYHRVRSRDWAQVTTLSNKFCYPLSYPTSLLINKNQSVSCDYTHVAFFRKSSVRTISHMWLHNLGEEGDT